MKTRKMKKIFAFLLAAAMLVPQLPQMGLRAHAAEADNQVADYDSSTSWLTYFGPNKDTEYAGRVITDKSVTPIGEDKFQVSLSAIASNKEIVGQSTIPVDVVFALDMSASMTSGTDNIKPMIEATNASIDKLLAGDLNIYNRVGVVFYSDGSDVVLPLARYDKNSVASNQFLTYNSRAKTVSTANGLKKVDGTAVGVKTVTVSKSATDTQKGLLSAMNLYANDGDTAVNGVKRIPILVLMGDGAPNGGWLDYKGLTGNRFGSGNTSTNALALLTQLTMMHGRNQMETRYGREPLVYTLGLGLNSTGTNEPFARSIFNPQQTTNDIKNLWTQFNNLNVNGTITVNSQKITKLDDTITADASYVDKYFPASNAADLTNAFNSIVEEIIIQSKYYPTHIGDGKPYLAGDIIFADEIGDYMQVTRYGAIHVSGTDYTGARCAKLISDDMKSGQLDLNDTEVKDILESAARRWNVTQEKAKALIEESYKQGYIYYNDDNDFGNRVSAYSTGDAAILSVVPNPEQNPNAAIPEGANCIADLFMYAERPEDSNVGHDIMHIGASLVTQLAEPRKQKVYVSIPASLIPLVEYEITLKGSGVVENAEDAEEIQVKRINAVPIVVSYEVGIRQDITAANVAAKVSRDANVDIAGDTYTFYTNNWDRNGAAAKTTAVLTPSAENEFYFFEEDTPIYSDEECTQRVTGDEINPNAASYYKDIVFKTTGDDFKDAKDVYSFKGMEVATKILDGDHHHLAKNSEGWYVTKGTSRFLTEHFTQVKQENVTKTADYFLKPVQTDNETADVVTVTNRLGNNGKISLTQLRSDLKIKKVVESEGFGIDRNRTFTFQVTLTDENGTAIAPPYSYTVSGGAEQQTDSDGKLTLKHEEEALFAALPVGTVYKVEEIEIPAGYTPDQALREGTIPENGASEEFTNTFEPGTATLVGSTSLSGTKTLTGRDWLASDWFEFTLAAADEKTQAAITNGLIEMPQETTVRTDSEHKYQFGNITFHAEDAYYFTITETHGNIGGITYSEKTAKIEVRVSVKDGELKAESSVVFGEDLDLNFENTYSVTPEPLTIGGEKTLTGKDLAAGEFSFRLTAVTDGAPMPAESQQTAQNDADGKFTFGAIAFTSAHAGKTYVYQVTEVNDGKTGYTYSDLVYTVTVSVTDKLDGSLKLTTTVKRGEETDDKIAFANSYDAVDAVVSDLGGTKTVSGGAYTLKEGDFSFTIAAVTANAPLPEICEVSNDSEGKFQFGNITFSAPGTYVYTVSEVVPAEGIAGISYLGGTYTVSVKVEDQDGVLTVTEKTMEKDGKAETEMAFTNAYSAENVDVCIEGRKNLVGREPIDGEFTFNLYEITEVEDEDGEIPPATEDGEIPPETEDGEIPPATEDEEIPPATEEEVIPTETEDGVTSTETENAITALSLEDENTVTENKTEDAISDGEDKETTPNPKTEKKTLIQTVTNNGSVFSFEKITYTEAGTYRYLVTETKGTDGTIGYSEENYEVTVTVTDDGSGKLSASVSIPAEKLVFENTYTPYAAKAVLTGHKFLTANGEAVNVKAGDFSFTLTPASDADPKPSELTAWNEADGNFAFGEITFSKAGVYHYSIVENNTAIPNVTYTNSVCTVTVTVEDVAGSLKASAAYQMGEETLKRAEFTNTYAPHTSVGFSAQKRIEGNKPLVGNDYTFLVTDSSGNLVSQATNDKNGDILFPSVSFTRKGTYEYTMSEVTGDALGVTYCDKVYEITVEVTADSYGNLTADVRYPDVEDGEIPTFVNRYTLDEVIVGGKDGAAQIVGTKKLEGRPLEDGEFRFELVDSDGKVAAVAANDKDGAFAFGAISFDKVGQYKYTVREVAGTRENVTYDKSVFTVIVVISDNGGGELTAEVVYGGNKQPTFTNVYTKPKPPTENPSTDSPTTGDNSRIVLWISLMLAAVAALAVMLFAGKRRTYTPKFSEKREKKE